MLKNKNRIIFFLGFIFLLAMLVSVQFYTKKYKRPWTTCFNLEKDSFGELVDSDMIDCSKYIHVKKGNSSSYLIKDSIYIYDALNKYEPVINVEAYRIIDDKVYVLGVPFCVEVFDGKGNSEFHFKIKKNNEYSKVKFANEEDIPRYFVINSDNGDLLFYNDFIEMPETDKEVFLEL